MIGTAITVAIAISGWSEPSSWEIACPCPMDLLLQDLREVPRYDLPVPGMPRSFSERRAPDVSMTLMPDIVEFREAVVRPNQNYTFSYENSPSGFKGEVLRRLGLVEMRSGGFGMTFRFASARNWAFQFKGMKKVTVAYVTRF